ncbi:hypothetical protein L210DRAFT_948753 [Boletus edulis BED1]|uniref:Uncharacterized protein n=1 Tax=Boletus edulis BED1 TaxID=1328754 RepID=A0AAD4BV61_BOLED|nr:hypothetical protein L210DRAFT_3565160 [Boletus edulis BED1]KAF8440978.1 hypothetical protein L210DRAFT_948753 [Boletus edulis BED1]
MCILSHVHYSLWKEEDEVVCSWMYGELNFDHHHDSGHDYDMQRCHLHIAVFPGCVHTSHGGRYECFDPFDA